MRRSKKKFNTTILILLVLSISLGYAFLAYDLNITGISIINNPTWDIHFENVQVKEGSVSSPTPVIDNSKTTVTYSVTLNIPGDYFEFTVDAVNAGTIDGMIDEIADTLNGNPINNNLPNALEYSITYDDDLALAENQILEKGDFETIKVHVGYKKDLTDEDLPDTEQTLNFTFTISYVQADNTAQAVNHVTLYNVLKKEATSGGLAREYTGAHHDSFTEEPSKKIYHWYAENDTEGTQVLDKNNVVFAGQCWQMIRTTDTGGVKLIYNGEAQNNRYCLNSRGTHVGYNSLISDTMTYDYWYGTDYTYDSSSKKFTVSGETEQVRWSASTWPGLIGKYTCASTNETYACSKIYLVESYNSASKANLIPIQSSIYATIGSVKYNENQNSPAYVGYMYGDVYEYTLTSVSDGQNFRTTQAMLSNYALNTTYWYADTIDYGTLATNKYSLVNPYQVSSTDDYPSLVGKYTFRNTSQTYTNGSVYYIAGVNGSTMYYIQLKSGNLLSAYEPIKFGDSITDNGNGTYTINNPVSVSLSDWVTNYDNYINKYTCNNSNVSCSNPRYITSATRTNYFYISAGEKILIAKERNGLNLTDTLLVTKSELILNSSNYSDYKYTCNSTSATCTEETLRLIREYSETGYNYVKNYYFGSSVTWDGTNYTLQNPIEMENYNNLNNISTHHYICLTPGNKICSTVGYVYDYSGLGNMFHITLSNGITTVEKALEDMLTKNTTNSTIKFAVDNWYKKYMLNYDNYIEDTIFCNDRSIISLGGWDSNGGMTNDEYILFKENELTTDLSCTNNTDKFSVSNPSARLTYKVGLMSSPEMYILNNALARRTGQEIGTDYWLISPKYYRETWTVNRLVNSSGGINSDEVNRISRGIRPAISLKPGTKYSSGSGTMQYPYIVNTSGN